MYWQKRFNRPNKDEEDEKLLLQIRKDHKDYGYRRAQKEMEKRGRKVNKKKVQRLIKKLKIQVHSYTRKSRKYSSYKGTVGRIAKNNIHRRFYTSVVHQKITTDTTEFKYFETDKKGVIRQGKLYLNPFLDMYNSEIISYRISKRPTAFAIMEGLEEAIEATSDCHYRRTFNSDQGCSYQMKSYSYKLKEHNIFQSMSRKGNCLDNSPIENCFGILKQEIYYGEVYRSFNELKQAIESYIEYYNNERMKSKLNWMSPIQFREQQTVLLNDHSA